MGHEASPEEIKKHIRTYMGVFIALAFFTVVTVAVSYLDLAIVPAVILGLVIATIKGALVAGYFMHLFQEKKIILGILLLTLVFFLVCLIFPLLCV